MTSNRVLFVLKYREQPYSPDTPISEWGDRPTESGKPLNSGLFNSASFVCDMLQDHGVRSKIVHCVDNSTIHRELVNFNATHVIIEAFWVVPEKFAELYRVCPNVKFIVRNHSESPFLAQEGIGFDWSLRYMDYPNVSISCNAPRMLNETRFLVSQYKQDWREDEITSRVPYLPNYYPIPARKLIQSKPDSEFVDIGCFGAIRPLKNHMIQAIAALKFADRIGKRLRFHINGGRIEMNGLPVLHNLAKLFDKYPQHELISHPWQEHGDFKELIKTMDLVSQVSFSETFNIVAADAVTVGVPVVTSNEIPWSSKIFHANPVDSNDVTNAFHRAYVLHRKLPAFNPSLDLLKKHNRMVVKEWLNQFG